MMAMNRYMRVIYYLMLGIKPRGIYEFGIYEWWMLGRDDTKQKIKRLLKFSEMFETERRLKNYEDWTNRYTFR